MQISDEWFEFLEDVPFVEEWEEKIKFITGNIPELYEDVSQRVMLRKSFGFLYPTVMNHVCNADLPTYEHILKETGLDRFSGEDLTKMAISMWLDGVETELKQDTEICYMLNEVMDDAGQIIGKDFWLDEL